MTKLLEKAFSQIAKLPDNKQDAMARFVLAEVHAEDEWEKSFASSQDELAFLAEQALDESNKGKTQPMNFDRDFWNHKGIPKVACSIESQCA